MAASSRRFTHNSSGQSKNPLTAITVSTAIIRSGDVFGLHDLRLIERPHVHVALSESMLTPLRWVRSRRGLLPMSAPFSSVVLCRARR